MIARMNPPSRNQGPHGAGRRSDRVYASLLTAIRDLEYVPGQRIAESSVAARLAVSRTPVREALARLSAEGLVRVTPQVGTEVGRISMMEVRRGAFVRVGLESEALRTITRLEQPNVTRMELLLTKLRNATEQGDHQSFLELDDQLHGELFTIAGYPEVWQLVQSTKVHIDRVRYLAVKETIVDSNLHTEHAMLVQSIRDRDLFLGLATVDSHCWRVVNALGMISEAHPEYFEA